MTQDDPLSLVGAALATAEAAQDRACLLVGKFMRHWASLEGEINRGVHELLELKGLAAPIATANISVRDKLNIIKTVVDLYPGGILDDPKVAQRALTQVGQMSGYRNLVAHTFFAADKDNVRFFAVKAKGKFEIPDTIWTEADFDAKFAAMDNLKSELSAIISATALRRRRSRDGPSALALALAGRDPNSSNEPLGRGLLGLLPLPPPENLGSLTATPEIDPRTPKEPKD